MKKILFLLITISNCTLGFSQELNRHIIKLEYGGVFLGSGDMLGNSGNFSYTYNLNKFIGINARLLYLQAVSVDKVNYDIASSRNYDLGFLITPFPKRVSRFSVELGASYRKHAAIYGSGYRDESLDNPPPAGLANKPWLYAKNDWGASMGMNIDVLKLQKLNLGIHGLIQFYPFFEDINSSLLIYSAFKL